MGSAVMIKKEWSLDEMKAQGCGMYRFALPSDLLTGFLEDPNWSNQYELVGYQTNYDYGREEDVSTGPLYHTKARYYLDFLQKQK